MFYYFHHLNVKIYIVLLLYERNASFFIHILFIFISVVCFLFAIKNIWRKFAYVVDLILLLLLLHGGYTHSILRSASALLFTLQKSFLQQRDVCIIFFQQNITLENECNLFVLFVFSFLHCLVCFHLYKTRHAIRQVKIQCVWGVNGRDKWKRYYEDAK